MKWLLVASSVVAWAITASISIWAFSGKGFQYNHLASEYAFNVIEQGLAGKSEPQVQLDQVSKWREKGWTAQSGALKTLCNIDQKRMEVIMDEKIVEDVCRLIRTPKPLSALTPLE